MTIGPCSISPCSDHRTTQAQPRRPVSQRLVLESIVLRQASRLTHVSQQRECLWSSQEESYRRYRQYRLKAFITAHTHLRLQGHR